LWVYPVEPDPESDAATVGERVVLWHGFLLHEEVILKHGKIRLDLEVALA
jgi:hypothetical protein